MQTDPDHEARDRRVNQRSASLSMTAITCIVASAGCFSAIDSIVKYLALRYSVPLLVWARWTIPALLIIVVLGPKMHWRLLRTANPKLHLVRGAVLTLSSLCFFAALRLLPLAEATGINYTTPIFVTLMASWLLRERLTPQRCAFIMAGFLGVLLIVRPGSAALDPAALFAGSAAVLNAIFQILTRRLADDDLPVLIFYPSIVGAVLMSLALPFLDYEASYIGSDAFLFVTIGVVGALGHFLFVRAFQHASASTIAPFTYTQVFWSTLAGWVLFGTFPDALSLTGLCIIWASAVIVTLHEFRRTRMALSDSRTARSVSSPIALAFPGAGGTEIKVESVMTRPAAQQLDIAVGGSIGVPHATGSPKAFIRTD